MNITTSGFYMLEDHKTTISDSIEVVLFDDGTQGREVEIWADTKVTVYGVIDTPGEKNTNFFQKKEGSELNVRYVLLSRDHAELKSKIFSQLSASHTKSDVQITSIVSQDGDIKLDGSIQIEAGIEKADANLIEENLFLGTTGKIQWIPTLLVASDNVKAAHACRMEKIPEDKLFYLRSRWIDKQDATHFMIESYINDMIWGLKEENIELYTSTFQRIIDQI